MAVSYPVLEFYSRISVVIRQIIFKAKNQDLATNFANAANDLHTILILFLYAIRTLGFYEDCQLITRMIRKFFSANW
jgi:hypothetical protein